LAQSVLLSLYTTVFPSGDITGLPADFRLIHFSKDTDAFFCAISIELVIRSTGRKIFFMVGVLVFKNREEWDRGSVLFMVKGGAYVRTPPAPVSCLRNRKSYFIAWLVRKVQWQGAISIARNEKAFALGRHSVFREPGLSFIKDIKSMLYSKSRS
jgi:hypothetical protein